MIDRTDVIRACRYGLIAALLALAACQSLPTIHTEAAAGVNFGQYRTYDFFAEPGTDRHGYKTIATRSIQDAVDREMHARGYVRASNPDLKINFNIAHRDKITTYPGAGVGGGFGSWRHGYGWGLGYGYPGDVETVTEGTLTIDLVDRVKNELVWSGSAVKTLDSRSLDQPRQAIDQAVSLIFAKYPVVIARAAPTT